MYSWHQKAWVFFFYDIYLSEVYYYIYIGICISSQMIFASNNTWYAWLTLSVWFFSLSYTHFLGKKEMPQAKTSCIQKSKFYWKQNKKLCFLFPAWFGEAYETIRPQHSKFISFKLQDLVKLASCCYHLPANQEQWNPWSGGFRIRYSGRQDQRQVHSSHKSCQPPNSSFGTAHHQTSRWWIS